MYCFQSKKRMVFYYVDGGLKILDFNSTAKKKKMFLLGQGWVIIFDLGPLQKFFKWPRTALKGWGLRQKGRG